MRKQLDQFLVEFLVEESHKLGRVFLWDIELVIRVFKLF